TEAGGRHLSVIKSSWQGLRPGGGSVHASPAGLTTQVGFIRLAHLNARNRVKPISGGPSSSQDVFAKKTGFRVISAFTAAFNALCPAMTDARSRPGENALLARGLCRGLLDETAVEGLRQVDLGALELVVEGEKHVGGRSHAGGGNDAGARIDRLVGPDRGE